MAKITASKEAAKKRVAARSKEHAPKTLKRVGVWSDTGVGNNVKAMKDMIAEIRGLIQQGETAITVDDGNRIYTASLTEVAVLPGNSKLGKMIWSVSLPPIIYCGNCRVCKNLCYDLRHDVIQLMCRVYRCINAALLEENGIDWFMDDVERQIEEKRIEVLRHNIGGDITSKRHLQRIVELAERRPQLHQLIFTKMYDLVNGFMDEVTENWRSFGQGEFEMPRNLHLFFSAWKGVDMDNPYNFPISFPVYDKEDIEQYEDVREYMEKMPSFYWHCGNDCTDCVLCQQGCFKLQQGEAVGFPLH